LKEAAALIRQGNTKSARQIIISVLREDQDNFQAWYMLSFSVPVVDKQIEALQRALLVSPDHPKALERLSKLGGEPLPPGTKIQPAKTPEKKPAPPAPEKASPPPFIEVPDDELLATRLFGATDAAPPEPEPEESEEPQPQRELTPEETLQALKQAVDQEQVTEQEVDFGEVIDEAPVRIKMPRRRSAPQKVFGINRNYFILGILIVIFSLLALLGLSPRFRQAVLPPPAPAATETGAVQAALTEAALSPPAPTLGQPSPTPPPTAAPAAVLFDLGSILPPSAELEVQFETIQQAVASQIGAQLPPQIDTYAITDPQLQTLIWDFAEVDGFEQQVNQTHRVFQLLGLASPSDDFNSFYQNYWVDPNGTLVLPDDSTIAVIGFEFSDYQKFSYAQAAAHLIRRQQSSETGLYQQEFPCFSPTEA